MNIESTELNNSTETAIGFIPCYQQCFCSDNLELMKTIESNTVDLIYCDILYGTGMKFKDYQDLKPIRIEIEAHYIPRIKEMHRILKPTGSIYLQMDTRINHWVRIMMDDIFGYDKFRNEIIWSYDWGNRSNKWNSKHDNILFYTKTNRYSLDTERVDRKINESTKKRMLYKGAMIKNDKTFPTCVWNIPTINGMARERVGYATQKPKALIERIIKASSNEGDLVADFYAGSFTTAEVCKDLNRNFIGCDINPKAVQIGLQRLNGGVS